MSIRLLDAITINRIAAGEVIERPASAVKELVENALDAGSTQVDVTLREGGKSLIIVADNGKGMSKEDLQLAVERHATSKLPDNDLMDIRTMGFRGEALPSIGSVSRLHLSSYDSNERKSWKQIVEGGNKYDLEPSNLNRGTKVEVRDLFFATPARLKFLKTDKTELSHIIALLEKIALIRFSVGLSLKDDTKVIFDYPTALSWKERVEAVLGREFIENAAEVSFQKDYVQVEGFSGLPTLNKSTGQYQFLYVNNRPVQDKLLLNAVRAAYADLMARDRFPMVVLNVLIPGEFLDVNVHPAKTEVRFQDSQLVRNCVIYAIREQLTATSHQASSTIHTAATDALKVFSTPTTPIYRETPKTTPFVPSSLSPSYAKQVAPAWEAQAVEVIESPLIPTFETQSFPLGNAIAQLFSTYILAQTTDEVIIVDQHAAHERLTYEKMKNRTIHQGVLSEHLLIPLVVDLSQSQMQIVDQLADDLLNLGFGIQSFGPKAVQITAIPSLLAGEDVRELFRTIVDTFSDTSSKDTLRETLYEICAESACKNSIKAGRKLSIPEMNQLLRDMERSSFSGQCNHGRPTYIKLQKADIDKLLGR